MTGRAPAWDEPWARARLVYVRQGASGYKTWLVDDDGYDVGEDEIQRARLAVAVY